MKVTARWVEGHLVLTYAYHISRGMGFRFHMLCEVGGPWQAKAKAQLAVLCRKHDSVVKCVELQAKPWYADTLVPKSP